MPGGGYWAANPILFDSQEAFAMGENARSTSRTCHIDCRFHFVCAGQAVGMHQSIWISGSDQMADLGTKAVPLSVLSPLNQLILKKVNN